MVLVSSAYKGGVGKTTLSQNIAVVLAHMGYSVVIIDADESQVTRRWGMIREEKEIKPHIEVIGEQNDQNITKTIQELYEKYDAVIIDCPPSYKAITTTIMLTSSIILIPFTPTGRSEVWTGTDFLEQYHNVMGKLDEADRVPAYFVVNKLESKVNMHLSIIEVLEAAGDKYGVPILNARLNKRAAYGEANINGLGAFEYGNKKAREEVTSLVGEIIRLNQ